MGSTISRLFSYLRRPGLNIGSPQPEGSLYVLLRLIFISLVAGALAGFLNRFLIQQELIPHPGPSLLNFQGVSKFNFFMGAVFIAPLMEELVFRWQLKRFSATLLFIALIVGLLLSVFSKTNWAFLISPFIFGILFLTYRFTIAGSLTRKFVFWKKIFPWHFYLTAICFALIHLANFEKGINLLPWAVFYTLPQLIIGLILGYTRMNYGLKYALALHSLYNLCFVSLLFLNQ